MGFSAGMSRRGLHCSPLLPLVSVLGKGPSPSVAPELHVGSRQCVGTYALVLAAQSPTLYIHAVPFCSEGIFGSSRTTFPLRLQVFSGSKLPRRLKWHGCLSALSGSVIGSLLGRGC